MIECNCIVIDDSKSFTTSSTMNNFLRRALENNKLQINLIHLNPKDERFVDDNGLILTDRIVNELNTNQYLKRLIHLVVCDYNLGDDSTNGFEIIRLLRNELKCKKKIILYSSNIDDVIDKIISGDNPEQVRKVIVDLVSSEISEFCQRNEHLEEEMIKQLLGEIKFSTDKYFEEELYKYRSYLFRAPYDKFKGKTLGDVADYIATHNHEGEILKKELIQQVVAYMIDLNDEE